MSHCHSHNVRPSIRILRGVLSSLSRNFPHSPTLVKCGVLLLLIVARAGLKEKIFPLVTEKILARVVDFAARKGYFRV